MRLVLSLIFFVFLQKLNFTSRLNIEHESLGGMRKQAIQWLGNR